MLGLSALAKGSSDDNSCVEVTAHRGSSGRVHFADRGVRLSARGAWQCNSQGSRTDWLTSQKRRTKPAATGNKRLSDQTRKILGKHHASKYRGWSSRSPGSPIIAPECAYSITAYAPATSSGDISIPSSLAAEIDNKFKLRCLKVRYGQIGHAVELKVAHEVSP
jgi:hypothetical protein